MGAQESVVHREPPVYNVIPTDVMIRICSYLCVTQSLDNIYPLLVIYDGNILPLFAHVSLRREFSWNRQIRGKWYKEVASSLYTDRLATVSQPQTSVENVYCHTICI
jgi:hypothetical protein